MFMSLLLHYAVLIGLPSRHMFVTWKELSLVNDFIWLKLTSRMFKVVGWLNLKDWNERRRLFERINSWRVEGMKRAFEAYCEVLFVFSVLFRFDGTPRFEVSCNWNFYEVRGFGARWLDRGNLCELGGLTPCDFLAPAPGRLASKFDKTYLRWLLEALRNFNYWHWWNIWSRFVRLQLLTFNTCIWLCRPFISLVIVAVSFKF